MPGKMLRHASLVHRRRRCYSCGMKSLFPALCAAILLLAAIPCRAVDPQEDALRACAGDSGICQAERDSPWCMATCITLRDNVELHLENGCTLLSLLKPIPEDNVSYAEASFNMKRCTICCLPA